MQIRSRSPKELSQRLERLRESLPSDIELVTIYDQSTFISSAVDDVRLAAVLGGLIAIFVLYGFLRDARATTIVGIAIPVSVIGTFLLMYTNGISLNIMSLGGIALAVGMLVDNSIVVLENIVRKREQGEGIIEAATNGTSEVSSAVFAATLTTVAVFFPMVFISGIAGQLFKDQALTVTFALLFSLLVALTLIPMLASLGAQSRYDDGGDGAPAELVYTQLSLLSCACSATSFSPCPRYSGPCSGGPPGSCKSSTRPSQLSIPACCAGPWPIAPLFRRLHSSVFRDDGTCPQTGQ